MFTRMLLLFILLLNFSLTFGQFGGEYIWTTDGVGSTKYYIGDFNGDGRSDKLRKLSSAWMVSFSKDTTFSPEINMLSSTVSGDSSYYVGDYNGDNMSDVLYCYFNGTSTYWKIATCTQNNSTGEYSFRNFNSANSTWGTDIFPSGFRRKQFIGDFNGDGKDDLLVLNGYSWIVSISTGTNFSSNTQWSSNYPGSQQSTDKIYIGDFNGDGYSDITIYKSSYGTKQNVWLVATSKTNGTAGFNNFVEWTDGQGLSSDGHYFGDLNGDGKCDKLNFYSRGEWFAAISEGDHFSNEVSWCTGQGYGAIGLYVGDFNGDELCDRVTNTLNREWYVALNNSPRPTPNNEKIVATWFSAWYNPGSAFWTDTMRDVKKMPVVGWPNNATPASEFYVSKNHATINAQIDAMIKVGINLIIVDWTNGFNCSNEICAAVDSLFFVMQNRTSGKIPIAISLGQEYWGPNVIKSWIDWENQYTLQNSALDTIYQKYCLAYPNIYFKYLGKPLMLAYISCSQDFPPRKPSSIEIPLWHSNKFTIKEAVNWQVTFAYYNTILGVYQNGMNTKKFWGWGAFWNGTDVQPYNKESMAVMPGTHDYWNNSGISIDRDSGNYYNNLWKRVIEVDPNFVLICDWNNWAEENAIEGCLPNPLYVQKTNWQDYHGNPQYDWYLQITRAYSQIYKTGSLPTDSIYIQDENYPDVYSLWTGSTWGMRKTISLNGYPSKKPIIKLPHKWLNDRNIYLQKSKIDKEMVPINFEVLAYPNPFNPTVNIVYTLPEAGLVEVKIYDILGREIESLVHEVVEKGNHKISWQASNFASGVYFYRISWKNNVISNKIILMK